MSDTADRESRGWVGWAQVGLLVVVLIAGIYFARSAERGTNQRGLDP